MAMFVFWYVSAGFYGYCNKFSEFFSLDSGFVIEQRKWQTNDSLSLHLKSNVFQSRKACAILL
jgi:hypothetical protein